MSNKTITATIYGGDTVRISMPEEQWSEPSAGHRQIAPGIIRVGHHIGRKWAVVHDYSTRQRRDGSGECYGDEYTAYDLTCQGNRDAFAAVLVSAHYTDLATGRDVEWQSLLAGACARHATADERRILVDAGYADDVDALVIAERKGAKLYHIALGGYAIEGETGEMITNLDADEAVANW